MPYSGGRRNRWIGCSLPALGLVEDNTIGLGTVTLDEDDFLLLYPDGAMNANNPSLETFGTQHLARARLQNSERISRLLVGAIRQELQAFTGGALVGDDMTLVVGVRD